MDSIKKLEENGAKIYEIGPNSWIAVFSKFLIPNDLEFKKIWEKHPKEFHKILIGGKEVSIPRWQQSYGHSYSYSGSVSKSIEPDELISDLIEKMNNLFNSKIFNMCLCNWYLPEHYIGPHSDDTRQLNPNSPIASLSWGYPRTFILTPKVENAEKLELILKSGDLVIMLGECQKTHKHEIKKLTKKEQKKAGSRINFTFRSFKIEKNKML